MIPRSLIIAVCLFISANAWSQARKYSNEFLSIGLGARALGMSNSVVSSADDVTAGYWNPAGLTRIQSNIQVDAMHAEYFAGIAKYDYGGLAYKIDSTSAFSLNVIRFGVDNIPNTINLIDANGNVNYDNVTSFSAADYAFLLSYGRKLKKWNLRVGGTAKIIYRKVGDMAQSWGFGLDGGLQWEKNNWKVGLLARDITTTFNAWSFSLDQRTQEVFLLTGNEIPENSTEITMPRIILGASYRYGIKNNLFSVSPAFNIDMTTDGRRNVLISGKPISLDPHLGLELAFKQIAYLRGGVGNIQKEKSTLTGRDITTFQPNIGVGLRIKTLQIDYAYTDIGNVSGAAFSHIISLKLDIHKKAKSSEG